jgi:hypothetical protein
MRTVRFPVGLLALLAVLSAAPAGASPVGVVRECGRTTGHAVRDSALTVGRTVRDFFAHGPHTAKQTWRRNAALTSADAHADAARVHREAHSE